MRSTRDISDWTCEGQSDLTDLVGVEHICGSMPASDADRDAARHAFYTQMRSPNDPRPECEHCFAVRNTCDACVEEGERP